MSELNVSEAFEVLKKALKDDDSYAYAWHANIAAACADSIHSDDIECRTSGDAWRIGNNAATSFMKICFDATTSKDMLLGDESGESEDAIEVD